jgi:hypothetical protein
MDVLAQWNHSVTGQAATKLEAMAEAERAIDRALALKIAACPGRTRDSQRRPRWQYRTVAGPGAAVNDPRFSCGNCPVGTQGAAQEDHCETEYNSAKASSRCSARTGSTCTMTARLRLLKPPDRRPRGHYVRFCHCASHVGGNFFATLNAADSSVSKAIFCASMTSPATR